MNSIYQDAFERMKLLRDDIAAYAHAHALDAEADDVQGTEGASR